MAVNACLAGMVASKTFSGCIYSNPPEQMQDRTDLTRSELLKMMADRSLDGLPILIEHETSLPVGKVLRMWEDRSNNFFVDFVVDVGTEGGRRCVDLMKKGLLAGLSLSHEYHSRRPLEVSLCHKGLRDSTWVINASSSGAWYKSRGDSFPITEMEQPNIDRLLALLAPPQRVNASVVPEAAPAPAPAQPMAAAPEAPAAAISQKRSADVAGLDSSTVAKKYATPIHRLIDSKGQVTLEDTQAVVDFAAQLAEERNTALKQLQESRDLSINTLAASMEEVMNSKPGLNRDTYMAEIEKLRNYARSSPHGIEVMAASARAIKSMNEGAARVAERGNLWESLEQNANGRLMSAFNIPPTQPAPMAVNASSVQTLGQQPRSANSHAMPQQDLEDQCVDAIVGRLQQFNQQCKIGDVYRPRGHRGPLVESFRLV